MFSVIDSEMQEAFLKDVKLTSAEIVCLRKSDFEALLKRMELYRAEVERSEADVSLVRKFFFMVMAMTFFWMAVFHFSAWEIVALIVGLMGLTGLLVIYRVFRPLHSIAKSLHKMYVILYTNVEFRRLRDKQMEALALDLPWWVTYDG